MSLSLFGLPKCHTLEEKCVCSLMNPRQLKNMFEDKVVGVCLKK